MESLLDRDDGASSIVSPPFVPGVDSNTLSSSFQQVLWRKQEGVNNDKG
jgi:hypothetical protein